jgi:hypothetical protein
MLKFGRVIDLDELEARSDRSKETEAENQLKDDEQIFKIKAARLNKESAALQEKLFEVLLFHIYSGIYCLLFIIY